MNLLQEVTELLLKQIDGLPKTAYQLNKKTGINITSCQQIINGTFNPTFRTLLEMKEKYGKADI
jgi:hypothetical protein